MSLKRVFLRWHLQIGQLEKWMLRLLLHQTELYHWGWLTLLQNKNESWGEMSAEKKCRYMRYTHIKNALASTAVDHIRLTMTIYVHINVGWPYTYTCTWTCRPTYINKPRYIVWKSSTGLQIPKKLQWKGHYQNCLVRLGLLLITTFFWSSLIFSKSQRQQAEHCMWAIGFALPLRSGHTKHR